MEEKETQNVKEEVKDAWFVWARVFAVISCFFACVGFLCLSVGMVAYSPRFYENQFVKNNTSERVGISDEDLQRISDGIIKYFSGASDTLQIKVSFDGGLPKNFYGDDELSHMADVKVIFLAVRALGWILLSVGVVVMTVILVVRKDKKGILNFGAIWGSATLLALGILLGLIIAVNFDAAFTVFHHIFFPQGNWQFNSPMIMVLQSSLFMDAAVYILIRGAAFAIALLAAGILLKVFKPKPNSPATQNGELAINNE